MKWIVGALESQFIYSSTFSFAVSTWISSLLSRALKARCKRISLEISLANARHK